MPCNNILNEGPDRPNLQALENDQLGQPAQCVHADMFVRTITSTIVAGFQNNLTQLFSITRRCAI